MIIESATVTLSRSGLLASITSAIIIESSRVHAVSSRYLFLISISHCLNTRHCCQPVLGGKLQGPLDRPIRSASGLQFPSIPQHIGELTSSP